MEIEKIRVESAALACALMGAYDENARALKRQLNVQLAMDGDCAVISGSAEAVPMAKRVVEAALGLARQGEEIKPRDVVALVALAQEGKEQDLQFARRTVAVNAKGRPVVCRTVGQYVYMQQVSANPLVLCVGPAGTGKTYLAVARAVHAYRNKEAERIILTRPAVEAGERLGFLPGDLQQKVDPYLRPLYDALQDLLGVDNFVRMSERGVIEVAPLAYMRGRTLNNSFIILDEAQNTTCEQMKMFLTRMGEGSRVIVTGDTTQIDLPHGVRSGLIHALDVLHDVEGVGICRLGSHDVVRHDLVQRIVDAYATYDSADN